MTVTEPTPVAPARPGSLPERAWAALSPVAIRVGWLAAIGVALPVGLAGMLAVSDRAPGGVGTVAAAGGFAAVCVVIGLKDPRWAFVFLVVATFLRPAIPKILPTTDPFILAFGGVVISALAWVRGRPERRIRLGVIELAMALYLLWNLHSILQPHEYPPLLNPLTGQMLDLWRYLIIGTVMPFVAYLVARMIFGDRRSLRFLITTLLVCAAYSAWVSILQFHGPQALLWPKYIALRPNWPDRAVGLPNQPQVNGLILIVGFVLCLVLMGVEHRPRWQRIGLSVIAAGSAYAIYLTHTRSVWLGFAVVVVLGVVLAKGYRTGFVATAVGAVLAIALNWSTFTSKDRSAGGVASTNEVFDRLNANTTAVWAFAEKPWSGWGLGRFVSINTYHHQQWSPETPWNRGLGIPAHQNELGIMAELGIVGLLLWLTVIVLISYRLIRAFVDLPPDGMLGRPLAFIAGTAFLSLVMAGLFVDLRLFDYPNTMVFALAGAAAGVAERFTHRPLEDPLAAGRARRAEIRAHRARKNP
ncbi:O-antigen ligase family protein [Nocardia sp. 2]|uniref:O-antigen ligase family protein n=1 Tax=Nocardia acididurans TaxID=2802282 RepID=A0ABS1M1H6_9NOCA|nr:O-antigen ligase family protein [Nocardia acididurans]MBL1074065.1 O-antigen ligase family protein [Nocardia acididurans]